MDVSKPELRVGVESRSIEMIDCVSEMSYLEIKIAEFSSEEDEFEESEITIQPHPLSAFLPPFIFTSHLSPTQKALQPFPYNMSTSNGIISWAVTFALSVLFFWIQNSIVHYYQLCSLGGSRSAVAIYVVVLVVEFFLGICSSLYPLVYGCVLRWNDGAWPSREMVWGSKGQWEGVDGESESLECGCEKIDSGKGSVVCSGMIVQYTLIGMLAVGICNLMKADSAEREENRCGKWEDEKLRLLEEGVN